MKFTSGLLLLLLFPDFTSAELRYDSVSASYSVTKIEGPFEDAESFSIGTTKGVTPNLYFGAGYNVGTVDTGLSQGDVETKGGLVSIGFHAPIASRMDGIVSTTVSRSSSEFSGIDTKANSSSISAGIRAEVSSAIETGISASYFDSDFTSDTIIWVTVGFKVTRDLQINFGGAVHSDSDPTASLGLTFFY